MDSLLCTKQAHHSQVSQKGSTSLEFKPHAQVTDQLPHQHVIGLLVSGSVTKVALVTLLIEPIAEEDFLHQVLVQPHIQLLEEPEALILQLEVSTVNWI